MKPIEALLIEGLEQPRTYYQDVTDTHIKYNSAPHVNDPAPVSCSILIHHENERVAQTVLATAPPWFQTWHKTHFQPIVPNPDSCMYCDGHYEIARGAQTWALAAAPLWFRAWHNTRFQPFVMSCKQGHPMPAAKQNPFRSAPPPSQARRNTEFDSIIPSKHANIDSSQAIAALQAEVRKNRNSKLGDDGPFYEVPFPDGLYPWGATVSAGPGRGHVTLRKLEKHADLQALSLPESYGYYIGYFPDRPVLRTTYAERIEEIAVAIGRPYTR